MTILNNIMAGMIAVLLLVLCIVLIMNANLRADIASVNAKDVALTRANLDFKTAILKQNQAIESLKAEGVAKTLAANKAVKQTAVQIANAKTEMAFLAHESVHGDDCAAAKQVLRDYLGQVIK